ncbi:hypothetical protein VR7878_03869 [Vibrio ruber DSM 16370]|uniref:Uncharacterized protein n=1 Tax=Vibrio ruber (strain DSM 16370 / JCM 11486 / BCRC 17186 / CECT 7878 / LMG 23124 / VR1) TaxID=1123498 RepID=A0A1R4LU86_VIBR1|nr:hypothetical protein [Vibrio ruber]SJN59969.1 hypothetical protein VR7878_03869 [Vibrio ruber DSM 16370]
MFFYTNVQRAIKLIDKHAVLYSHAKFPGWEISYVCIENHGLVETIDAYAIVTLKNGRVIYVPFEDVGQVRLPNDDELLGYDIRFLTPEQMAAAVDKKRQLEFIVAVCLFLGFIAAIQAISWKRQQDELAIQNAMQTMNNMHHQKRQEAYNLLKQAETTLEQREKDLGSFYVYTNAKMPLNGYMIPNQYGFSSYVSEIQDYLEHPSFRNADRDYVQNGMNPISLFLSHENTQGYRVGIYIETMDYYINQSIYYPGDKHQQDSSLWITKIQPVTEAERAEFLARNPNLTQEDLKQYQLDKSHFSRSFILSQALLNGGKMNQEAYMLTSENFAGKERLFFISSKSTHLTTEQQDQLIEKFIQRYDFKRSDFKDYAWRKVSVIEE